MSDGHYFKRERLARRHREDERRTNAFGTPVRWHERARDRLLGDGVFGDKPGSEEREAWAEVHEAYIRFRSGEGTEREAMLTHAVCDATWFARAPTVLANLPTSKAWQGQILVYAQTMHRLRDHREKKREAFGNESMIPDAPTNDQLLAVREHEEAFLRWFRPIEEHQTRAHRCFMRLATYGSAAHGDLMRKAFERGDKLNDFLGKMLLRGAITWTPGYTLVIPADDWGRIFPCPRSHHYRDVWDWWGKFAGAAHRFYPGEDRLPAVRSVPALGYGLDEVDDFDRDSF